MGSAVLALQIATRMVLTLPDGALAVPGAGHAVMTDNPEGFAHAVKTFLTRLRFARGELATRPFGSLVSLVVRARHERLYIATMVVLDRLPDRDGSDQGPYLMQVGIRELSP